MSFSTRRDSTSAASMVVHVADSEIQEGQVFNRFLLLADMVGAMTTDESQCSCVCCTDQPAPETKSCIPDLVGSFHIGAKDMEKEGACDYRACHKCFPLTWPEDKKSVVKQDGVEFGNRRRQGTILSHRRPMHRPYSKIVAPWSLRSE